MSPALVNLNDSFRTALDQAPHKLIQPSNTDYNSSISYVESLLNPLAKDVSETQIERQKLARAGRKRKRGSNKQDEEYDATPLRINAVYTQGLNAEQIWQQAKRVLEAATDEIERELETFAEDGDLAEQDSAQNDEDVEDDEMLSDDEDLGVEGVDYEIDGEDGSELDDLGSDDLDEDMEGLQDDYDEDDGLDEDMDDGEEEEHFEDAGEEYVKDPNDLNDGFFNIDQFNKATSFLENQDARGDPDDGAASDEEDIDWAADPMTMDLQPSIANNQKQTNKKKPGRKNRSFAAEEEDDDDEEDGPTFGNADLNAPFSDSDDEGLDAADAGMDDDGMGDFANTNEIHYKDFFAPPAKQKSKKSRGPKPRPAKTPKHFNAASDESRGDRLDGSEEDDESDGGIQLARDTVHRDLFSDEEDLTLSDSENKSSKKAKGTSRLDNLSTYERSQLALRDEIRRLEQENISAKPWLLTGETVAPARPENALLEEDLEFERAGKPVPIPSTETEESIESLIKRRVLAREFDEVPRRRPTDMLGQGADPRRGRVQEELPDTKPQRGLADEYENDFLRRNDPNYVDGRSEALKKKHEAIQKHWAEVSAQLDALSNWHYKPRPAEASISVRTDVPTLAMEDARPSAGDAMGSASASTLAPQEVYRVGDEGKRGKGELVTKGGNAIAREEAGRDDSKRRRRREKSRRRKELGNNPVTATATNGREEKARAQKEMVGNLKKGGAKVIGKTGELTDVDGKSAKTGSGGRAGSSFKL